jgi:hypothetical protein
MLDITIFDIGTEYSKEEYPTDVLWLRFAE